MKKNPDRRFKAWSFSRFHDYEDCPAKAAYKHLDKMQEPKGPALQRGADIAKMCEDVATGKVKKIPKELETYKGQFELLRTLNPMVEQEWGFNRDWSKGSWTDWANCWLRVKLDAAALDGPDVIDAIDDKTGKVYPYHKDQLSLYATVVMIMFPAVKLVRTHLWYLDQPIDAYAVDEFSIKQKPALIKDWEKKVKPMFNDREFLPKPGVACMWCHFSKKKGGPCKY